MLSLSICVIKRFFFAGKKYRYVFKYAESKKIFQENKILDEPFLQHWKTLFLKVFILKPTERA